MPAGKFSILAIGMLLSGCAQQTVWDHRPPINDIQQKQQQYAGDWSFCVAQANVGSTGYTSDLGGQMMSLAAFQNLRDMCMIGKGWYKVAPKPEHPVTTLDDQQDKLFDVVPAQPPTQISPSASETTASP